MSDWIQRNPLLSYFIITFAFSWTIYFALVAMQSGWTELRLPYWIHYLARLRSKGR